MTEQPDYDDDWGPEEPAEPDTLAELVTRLAGYAGLTIATDAATGAPYSAPPITVAVHCDYCGVTHAQTVLVTPGTRMTVPGVHLCGADLGDGKHSRFSFTITVGG